ncbi:hypothetical protein L6452_17484 [Arctium lappa]|uniref:Uncharacterized protein n=1 Tax=Arctium lappa TaxID=4217 RepID=A0ACB9C3P0_ARCLA|nr:hypothetical protein L6452_17484 [Arctium lappa]
MAERNHGSNLSLCAFVPVLKIHRNFVQSLLFARLTRGNRLRILKPFSKFTNTAASMILLDFDDDEEQGQKSDRVDITNRGNKSFEARFAIVPSPDLFHYY